MPHFFDKENKCDRVQISGNMLASAHSKHLKTTKCPTAIFGHQYPYSAYN